MISKPACNDSPKPACSRRHRRRLLPIWHGRSGRQAKTGRAKAALIELRGANPTLATVPDYLGVIALAEGNAAQFVSEMEIMARLRSEAGLAADARALRAALDRGPAAVTRALVKQGRGRSARRAAQDAGLACFRGIGRG